MHVCVCNCIPLIKKIYFHFRNNTNMSDININYCSVDIANTHTIRTMFYSSNFH